MSETTRATAAGVRAAAESIRNAAILTPLLENEWLNELAGGRVLMKAETLQHGGSFKFRGAMTRLSRLTPAERERGVLAWSSGNHAQGVARAAKLFGMRAVIVMPKDAPALKVAQVKAYGGEIVFFDRYSEDREEIGRRIAADQGLALAPSYDHKDIIEGQGTLALEAVEQAAARGASIDAFLICCGGGGMTSGCATILEEISPATEIYIAEPEGYDESWASIEAGRKLTADISKKTICDALATPSPGDLTFAIMRRRVKGGFTLSDAEVAETVAWAFKYLKLVLEPGGAVALAAVHHKKFRPEGRTVALTLSGGNVDPALYAEILARYG
ncbi:MAG TPA: threonine/serine dehydratase [Parvularculaceae bacterium]|nr:threonine/serine dehydratase [Parvularculaceae bacterium]HNS85907.1 threonine/serine dehydratase [Parvularculaceae bacterium]